MKAFVTGGTGFIGGHLVRHLAAHGYEVSTTARTFERALQIPAEVRGRPGNILRPETLVYVMRGADVVFHVAALCAVGLAPREYDLIQRTNVEGARRVLELALELGVPRIVYTSDAAVYGDTRGQFVDETSGLNGAAYQTEYQRSKRRALVEVVQPLQQKGAPIIVVAPGATYGPGDLSAWGRTLRKAARHRVPVVIGPGSARAWTYVEDVAAGHRLAAEKGRPGETYILAGPGHTRREFFQTGQRVGDLKPPWLWWPDAWAERLAGLLRGVRPAWAEALRAQAGVTYLARAEKAQRELGWQARTLEAGLPPTLAALRQETL
jgi:nucleoside-diphosphate-sugar epimerase